MLARILLPQSQMERERGLAVSRVAWALLQTMHCFWPGEIKCGGALVDQVGDLKENICGPLLISSYRILIARQMLAWEGSDLSPRPIYKWFRGTAPCRLCRFKVVHLLGECVAVTRFLHSFIRVSE